MESHSNPRALNYPMVEVYYNDRSRTYHGMLIMDQDDKYSETIKFFGFSDYGRLIEAITDKLISIRQEWAVEGRRNAPIFKTEKLIDLLKKMRKSCQ